MDGVTDASTSSTDTPATRQTSGEPAGDVQVTAVPERLFHVVERDVWEQAVRDGAYVWSTRGVTVADEGFVHLSRADQVAGTLGLFYADVPGELLLLVVDPELTDAPMRLEGGFFHTYGELPITAVVDVLLIARDAAGVWVAPV